jgi:hypothetical protein
MAYTVNQLVKLSGISIRTIHFYNVICHNLRINREVIIMAKARKIPTDDVSEHLPPLSKKVKEAIASLGLEGIVLSPDVMKNVLLFDAGKISEEEFIKKAIERAKS